MIGGLNLRYVRVERCWWYYTVSDTGLQISEFYNICGSIIDMCVEAS